MSSFASARRASATQRTVVGGAATGCKSELLRPGLADSCPLGISDPTSAVGRPTAPARETAIRSAPLRRSASTCLHRSKTLEAASALPPGSIGSAAKLQRFARLGRVVRSGRLEGKLKCRRGRLRVLAQSENVESMYNSRLGARRSMHVRALQLESLARQPSTTPRRPAYVPPAPVRKLWSASTPCERHGITRWIETRRVVRVAENNPPSGVCTEKQAKGRRPR